MFRKSIVQPLLPLTRSGNEQSTGKTESRHEGILSTVRNELVLCYRLTQLRTGSLATPMVLLVSVACIVTVGLWWAIHLALQCDLHAKAGTNLGPVQHVGKGPVLSVLPSAIHASFSLGPTKGDEIGEDIGEFISTIINHWKGREYWIAWALILPWCYFCSSKQRLAWKLYREFKYYFKYDANGNRLKWDHERYKWAGFFTWLRWSAAPVIGVCLVLGTLPEILHLHGASWPYLMSYKFVWGFLTIYHGTKLMAMHTIEGSKVATQSSHDRAPTNDSKYLSMTALGFWSHLPLVIWWTCEFFSANDVFERKMITERICDRIVIWTYVCLAIYLVIAKWHSICNRVPGDPWYFGSSEKMMEYVWFVRDRHTRNNDPSDLSWISIFVNFMNPSKTFDLIGVDERMARRINDHWCRSWSANHCRNMRFDWSEMSHAAQRLLEHPIVDMVDLHTQLMLYIVKTMVVDEGRLNPLDTNRMKPPFKKREIKKFEAPVCGLLFAEWDEQYSDETADGTLKVAKTESSPIFKTGVEALSAFKRVDKPRWFLHEFEGVLTYEALIAPFAAVSNTIWPDLVSDGAMELLTFCGLGQALLVGKGSASVKKTIEEKKPIPCDTEYLMDLSYLESYGVREKHARYGFVATYNSKKELTHIYVSHWNEWVARPGKGRNGNDSASNRWEHAKFVMKASLGCGVTLKEHLLYTHWIVSNTASLAMRECLQRDHPVRRLMHIFILRTPSINYASSLTLLPEDRFVHRTAGFEFAEQCRCVEDCCKAWKYQTFPDFLESRDLGPLASGKDALPWAKDGRALWNEAKNFVVAGLALYYSDDEAVLKDEEIVEMWNMINGMPSGPADKRPPGKHAVADGYGYKLPQLDSGKGAKANLVDYLTHVIFWVTGNHELYGAVGEYFTTPMGLTTKIYDETCEENGIAEDGQVMADVQTYMQSLSVVSATGYPQPRLVADWAYLMIVQDCDEDSKWSKLNLNEKQKGELRHYIKLDRMEKKREEIDEALTYDGVRMTDTRKATFGQSNVNTPGGILDALKLPTSHEELEDVIEQTNPSNKDTERLQAHKLLLKCLHAEFVQQLLKLSTQIQEQNSKREEREHPFAAYDPMNLECSVNI